MKWSLLLILFSTMIFSCHTEPVKKVDVIKTESGYQLLRDGEPYYIKGIGGKGPYDLLAEYGGNSIRTWGIGDWDEAFAEYFTS